MLLPDGTVLQHEGVPYDPQKAHLYYLRTRHLHPRGHQQALEALARTGDHRVKPVTYTIRTKHGAVKLTAKQYAEQSAYAARRVALIRAKLARLTADLHKRLEAAKKRQANAHKPQTAAEKAKAAAQAKKYRQAHHQTLADKRKRAKSQAGGGSTGGGKKAGGPAHKHHTETVASLQAEIVHTRDSLKAAVAHQRELSTATKSG